MVALILYSKDLLAQTKPVDIFHILCDGHPVGRRMFDDEAKP